MLWINLLSDRLAKDYELKDKKMFIENENNSLVN